MDSILRFAARIGEVYAASARADGAVFARLRQALADDGYDLGDLSPSGGDVSGVSINKRGIEQMRAALQKEFNKVPLRIPVEVEQPEVGVVGTASIVINNGPVVNGDVTGGQMAWGNDTVRQIQDQCRDLAAGYEGLVEIVNRMLEGLDAAGLASEDREAVEGAAQEVLDEAVSAEPSEGKIRKAATAIRRALAPMALGVTAGAAQGAGEWAHTAVGAADDLVPVPQSVAAYAQHLPQLPGDPHGIAVFPGADHGLFTAPPDPAVPRTSQLAAGFLPCSPAPRLAPA